MDANDVIRRLFTPASYLPEPRNEQAIVSVSSGGVEQAITHKQIENLIWHGIEQLRKCGVKEGDTVVFCCENRPEFSSTILACWALKAMATLIDYRAKPVDVLEICQKLDAKLLLTSKKLYAKFESEAKLFTNTALLDVTQFDEFKSNALKSQFDIGTLDLDRPALALLTSGTTGPPKTSVHNLRSLVQNIVDLVDAAGLQGNMTALTPLPISHIYGLAFFLVSQVLGFKTVLTELEPVGFIKAIHRHKPELIAALPQFYGALLRAPEGYIDLSNARLLLCGGAPLTISLADKFEEAFGKQLNNGYGSTECKLVAFNKDGPVLSVGKPVGDIKVNIVNEKDEVLPEGELGEVRITGSMFMEGYLDNDKETKKVLHDGHYYTGDIGYLKNGYLFVVGRKGDVVIVGGVVVQAGEVEDALRSYEEVKDVAVMAIPNNHLGQIIKATVVLMDDKITDKQQLERQFKAFCKENLSRYKRPMKWEFLGPHDDLPKTLAGKTDKKTMESTRR